MAPVVVLVDRYPELSESFVVGEVRALRELGLSVRVESLARPRDPGDVTERADAVWEDESTATRLRAVVRLALRHPLRCARDVAERRRWRREEGVPPLRMLAPAALRIPPQAHLHAHFAAGAALAALRLGRVLGVPYSVTAHAWEIYQRPANLAEKLRRAQFATSGCEYTVADLRRLAPAARIHKVVMGVDGDVFRRRAPHPAGRTVLAVGRLVEKKGFGDLIEAAALMRAASEPVEILIAGGGPLHAVLAEAIAAHGLEDHVRLLGAVGHDRVRALLERADVLCMPCVVAADGDRDSMPVVVKEALAMEVPVVATREVGLPEVVRPEWGALVPPRDPPALARALARELARPVEERAARGRAGRAWVLEHCDQATETRRLVAMITGRWPPP